jgi:hypothetical protein
LLPPLRRDAISGCRSFSKQNQSIHAARAVPIQPRVMMRAS